MLVGLQGTGKTTTAAKLGVFIKAKLGKHVLLGAGRHPPPGGARAARAARRAGRRSRCSTPAPGRPPPQIARAALVEARRKGFEVLLFDTAGRLHVDEELMARARRAARRSSAQRGAVRGRRDDRSGRGPPARGVRGAAAAHRRHPHQARRRRPRRRRALRGHGGRQADPLRRGRRAARGPRAVPPRPHGGAHPRHGRHADPLREGPGRRSTRRRPPSSRRSCKKEGFDLEDLRDQLKQMRGGGLARPARWTWSRGRRRSRRRQEDRSGSWSRFEAIICSMTPQERRHPEVINGSRASASLAGRGPRSRRSTGSCASTAR